MWSEKSPQKRDLSQNLKEAKEQAVCLSAGRVFWAEGIVCAKVLGQTVLSANQGVPVADNRVRD